jgi:hypothetical protein
MTRKHFRAMADNIKKQLDTARGSTLEPQLRQALKHTAETFASMSARSNPRFDRSRFFRACGLE